MKATISEGENLSEIQSLTDRAESLSQAVDWWNTAMIWALVFAAIAAIVVVATTRRAITSAKQLSSAQEELIRAKDRQLAIDLRDKDAKIADAVRGSSEANLRAEEAKERAMNTGKEVAKLQTEAADAKRRQAEAEKQLAEVKIRQTPRNLRRPSDMVLSILKTAPPGKAKIWYQQADAESALFAMGLNFRLRDAGWQILEYKAIPSSIVYGAGNQDIDFLMRDLLVIHSSDSLQALVRVLQLAAITWGGLGDPKLPDDTPRIIIHPKP